MFGAMVDELWRLRDRNQADYDEGLSALAKLLGNSTYGKFAMKQERSAIVFARDADDSGRRSPKAPTDAPPDDDPSLCFLCGDELRGLRLLEAAGLCDGCEGSKPANADVESDVWYQAHRVDASYVIPHVSAHITALARVRLWEFMKMAVEKGGRIYYLDTDSLITDVELPTSNRLGDLKDEYPGESLRYMAVQPKVYMIERMNLNADVERRRGVIAAAARGEDVDASTLDGTYTKERDERDAAQLSEREREILALGRLGDAHDASTLDGAVLGRRNYILKPDYKVTMKGFPGQAHQRFEHAHDCTCDRCALSGEPTVEWVMRSIRNRENLERLADGETLEWRRLQKVRTLARDGFKNGPQMADVSKSFRSRYDKRIVLPDGIETEARVVDEHEDHEEQDDAEAAE